MKKPKLNEKIYYLILLMPILDLVTGLVNKFSTLIITPGIIIRGIILLISLIYVFALSKSTNRKKSIFYLLILGAFCLAYFITKDSVFSIDLLFKEATYMFKYMFFPVTLIAVFNLIDDYNIDKKKILNYLFLNSIFISFIIIIAHYSGTATYSYDEFWSNGTVGWFTSANEIGAILISLFPIVLIKLYENLKVFNTIAVLVAIIALSLIGTKVGYIGLFMGLIIFSVYNIITNKTKRKMKIIIFTILLIFSISFIAATDTINDTLNIIRVGTKNVEKEEEKPKSESVENKTSNQTDEKSEILKKESEKIVYKENPNSVDKILQTIFSGRQTLLERSYIEYKETKLINKLFGLGFIRLDGHNKLDKLIELDLFDILFRYGIIGFILYIQPILFLIKKMLKKIKCKEKHELYLAFYIILILMGTALICGHTFGAPGVSIYIVIAALLLESKRGKLT